MLLFQIKSQLGVADKSFYKKACNVVFYSSKIEEITLPHEFMFMFINGPILLEKSSQKGGVWEKKKKKKNKGGKSLAV